MAAVLAVVVLLVGRAAACWRPAQAATVAKVTFPVQRLLLAGLMTLLVVMAFRSRSPYAIAFSGFFAFYGLFNLVMAILGVTFAARPSSFTRRPTLDRRGSRRVAAGLVVFAIAVGVAVALIAGGWAVGAFVGVFAAAIAGYGLFFVLLVSRRRQRST